MTLSGGMTMFSIGGVVSGFGTAAPQSGQYEKFRATSVLQQGHCFPPFIRIIAVFKRSISAYAFDTSVYFSSSSAFGKDASEAAAARRLDTVTY